MKKANFKADTEIKRVYRKAKPVDMEKCNEAKAKEHATMIRARQIALNLNLDMKIGDVEYQGDGSKVRVRKGQSRRCVLLPDGHRFVSFRYVRGMLRPIL